MNTHGQMHILPRIKNGIADLIIQDGKKLPGFIRSSDGEAKVVEGEMWIVHAKVGLPPAVLA
jgi:hypothetical protein